jgi:hypothetical protein
MGRWLAGLGPDDKLPETLHLPPIKGLISSILASGEFIRKKDDPSLPLVWYLIIIPIINFGPLPKERVNGSVDFDFFQIKDKISKKD